MAKNQIEETIVPIAHNSLFSIKILHKIVDCSVHRKYTITFSTKINLSFVKSQIYPPCKNVIVCIFETMIYYKSV